MFGILGQGLNVNLVSKNWRPNATLHMIKLCSYFSTNMNQRCFDHLINNLIKKELQKSISSGISVK